MDGVALVGLLSAASTSICCGIGGCELLGESSFESMLRLGIGLPTLKIAGSRLACK